MGRSINVCYAISDKKGTYAKILGTSIYSLLSNTKSQVSVYILHDETLTSMNRFYLESLFKGNQHRLVFRDVSRDYGKMWDKIHELAPLLTVSRLSIATFFRLLLGEVFTEEERFIYLDADTIVNLDITELWEQETAPSGLAAVPDIVIQTISHNMIEQGLISQEEYFNAGVLLIDMEKFRKVDNFVRKSLEFMAMYKPDYLDQDILNYFFPHSCVLPLKYNSFIWKVREDDQPVKDCIYHYVGNNLGFGMEDRFNALFFKYFTKTPWCNEVFIGNMAENFDYVRHDMMELVNACAGKRRIVIGGRAIKNNIFHLLKLKEEEQYIPFEEIEKADLKFSKSRDLILLFLKDEDYNSINEKLIYYGLQENVHFINMLKKIGVKKSNISDYNLFLNS